VVLGLAWYFPGFANPTSLLCLVPTLVLLFVLGWSLALLAQLANVYFRDTQHLREVGFQILFYATPVMYKEDMLRQNGLGWLVDFNPLVPVLKLVREPILTGAVPTLETIAAATVAVLGIATVVGFVLSRLQRRLIFQL
jgi:ABC-type polysaccharide/polyol phosphate export permease